VTIHRLMVKSLNYFWRVAAIPVTVTHRWHLPNSKGFGAVIYVLTTYNLCCMMHACRRAASVCDVPDVCGAEGQCPDAKKPDGTSCYWWATGI